MTVTDTDLMDEQVAAYLDGYTAAQTPTWSDLNHCRYEGWELGVIDGEANELGDWNNLGTYEAEQRLIWWARIQAG